MILAGIDEAGYGPLLGPLCVAMVVLRIEPPSPAAEPSGGSVHGVLPDLWEVLRPAVVAEPRLAGPTAAAVADSKRLKLPNTIKSKHPLHHLERGVLAFAHEPTRAVGDDLALCRAFGAVPPLDRAWWSGPAIQLPLSCSGDELALLRTHVAAACERAGVRLIEARCLAMDAPEFNNALRAMARHPSPEPLDPAAPPGQISKARVLFAQVLRHLRRLWASSEAALAGADPSLEPPRVVVDRQGGRTDYLPVLREGFPDARVACLGMNTSAASYELTAMDADQPRRMRVLFRTEAESHAMPVALASMLAKLVRELWMLRFNAYWCGMMPELKPTAGYVADGRRWLTDAHDLIDHEIRAQLCRER